MLIRSHTRCQALMAMTLVALGLSGCAGVNPTPRPSAAPQPTQTAISGQFEITEKDNGRAFTYALTSRFSVVLDRDRYPPAELACKPEGVVGAVSNIPEVAPPLYAARFEAVAPGACLLQDRDFRATIMVTP